MTAFYTVTFSNTSRNGVQGLKIQTVTMTDADIIRAADAECTRQGTSLIELAGIEMIEDADGNFAPARDITPEETLAAAVAKLGDDGRLFEISAEGE